MNNKFNYLYIEEYGFSTHALIYFETYERKSRIFVSFYIYLCVNKLKL